MFLLLALEFVANALLALNYFLNGEMTGCLTCLLGAAVAIVNAVLEFRGSGVPKWLLAIYLVLFIAMNAAAYRQPVDMLPIFCGVCYVMALSLGQNTRYRLFCILNNCIWCGYDLLTGTFSSLPTHAAIVLLLAFTIARFDLHLFGKREKTNQ